MRKNVSIYLLEVWKRAINIVLVVEAQAAHVDRVRVHVVQGEHAVGGLGRLGVAPEEDETLGLQRLQR